MNNNDAIGIFDSGVGGLGVLKAIRQKMPMENLVYVADTFYTPWGARSSEFIESRVFTIANFLVKQPVKLILVACNTATAAAVNSLRENYSIPIVGIEPALKPALEYSRNKKVGVLATHATLQSKKYQDLKTRFADQAEIFEVASSLLVELVESAVPIEQSQLALMKQELDPFIINQIDSLVLGCTHFPFLSEQISQIVGPDVRLFESGIPVANEVQRRLGGQLNEQSCTGSIHYFSSAPSKAQKKFDALLGETVNIQPF